MLRLAVLFAALAAPALAAGGLTWETTRVEAKAALGQERFEAVFAFKNTGEKPVTITSTESSCGCTTARLAKNTFAPNEAGTIRALFEFGDRSGPQQKVITVHTNDGAPATHLVLKIEIPELLALDRDTLQWATGGAAAPQSVLVRIAPGATLKELDFDPAALEATLTTLPAGGGYRITVRPRDTTKPFRQLVRVHAEFSGQPRVVPLQISVR